MVPGTWINAINVSKGVGSVTNGYESITGQIDIDIQKPFGSEGEKPLYINFYGDNDQRLEGNLNYRFAMNDNLSSITLLHASSRNRRADRNADLFTDMPTFQIFNIMQRWQYLSFDGWESQLGFRIVSDEKMEELSTQIVIHFPFINSDQPTNYSMFMEKLGMYFPKIITIVLVYSGHLTITIILRSMARKNIMGKKKIYILISFTNRPFLMSQIAFVRV